MDGKASHFQKLEGPVLNCVAGTNPGLVGNEVVIDEIQNNTSVIFKKFKSFFSSCSTQGR
jgi:hypothetical protein